MENKGTVVRLKVHPAADESGTPARPQLTKWTAEITNYNGKDVAIRVLPPADAMVGEYKLSVETTVTENGETKKAVSQREQDIIVLFNPWCEGR